MTEFPRFLALRFEVTRQLCLAGFFGAPWGDVFFDIFGATILILTDLKTAEEFLGCLGARSTMVAGLVLLEMILGTVCGVVAILLGTPILIYAFAGTFSVLGAGAFRRTGTNFLVPRGAEQMA